MTPSAEYRALKALTIPDRSGPGDMWLCRRLGIVKVFNGHKRGSRHGIVYNCFHLYHWGRPAMWAHPSWWRDNDPNASVSDPTVGRPGTGGERWEYLGNMFEMLPYALLTGEAYSSSFTCR